MKKHHPIDNVIREIGTSLEGLGRILGVTKAAVYQWKEIGRQVPIRHCLTIERVTNGAVTRKDLRPNDWHLIWPEIDESPATEVPKNQEVA